MAYRHKDLEVCCAAACERTTRFSSQASQARMQMAADRKVLPLKIGIRVYGTGQYSGDYTVEDTGGKVDGHHIDLYMPSQAEEKSSAVSA